jgi:anti-sigma factor RsiW
MARDITCDQARARISLDLDGELHELGKRALTRHLGRCPACREFAGDAAAFTSAIRSAPLESYLVTSLPRRRRARGRLIGVPSAVALLLVGTMIGANVARDLDGRSTENHPQTSRTGTSAVPLLFSGPKVKLPIGQRSAQDDF